MTTKTDIEQIFNTFIADEDKALATGTDGDWYIYNWPTLNHHLSKAPKILSTQKLEQLYFHLLRLGILPGKEVAGAYPVLESAYRRHAPMMKPVEGIGRMSLLNSFTGLLLFGCDAETVVGTNAGPQDYLRYRAAYRQCAAYSHMPGMLSKPERFVELAGDALVVARICSVMRRLDFIHDDWYRVRHSEEIYSWTWLPFWGAIYTLLLSPLDDARQTTADFKSTPNLPLRKEQMETLERYEVASRSFLAR